MIIDELTKEIPYHGVAGRCDYSPSRLDNSTKSTVQPLIGQIEMILRLLIE